MFASIIKVGRLSSMATIKHLKIKQKLLLPPPSFPLYSVTRNITAFLDRVTANQLWSGVTGVSNAGRNRGRAKANRRARSKNLNKGQYIGVGSDNIIWPGLNTAVFKGNIIKQERLPPDPARLEKLIEIRNKMTKFRRYRLQPLERGFSGNNFKGRRIGPPDPILGDSFEGFESIVLDIKFTCKMDGIFGRVRGFNALVITGNGNGIIGLGTSKSPSMMSCINKAKNKAGRHLLKVNIENESIPSSFVAYYHHTKIFCERKGLGNGLVCSRMIAAICKVAGIKNMRARIFHSRNRLSVAKAFVQTLSLQKSHQELADQKRLNIIDVSGSYPKLISKPTTTIRKQIEIDDGEELNVDLHTYKGVLFLDRKKFRPKYTNHKYYKIFMRQMEHARYKYRIKARLYIENGSISSFIDDKFSIYKLSRDFQIRKKHMTRVQADNPDKELDDIKDKHLDVITRIPNLQGVY